MSTTTQAATPEQVVSGQQVASEHFWMRPRMQAACVAALLLIGILRIVSTYHVFNNTIDEASHIEGGIEWWQKGTYTLETKHAPLGRISVALLPYLAGVRWTNPKSWMDAAPVLSANGRYWLNLTLGRIGVLPYFVIGTLVVFFWTRRIWGPGTALLAVVVFTQLPTILTHSSVAATDLPLTAMFCWSLYEFTVWLKEPSTKRSVIFGIAAGLALSTKFSTLVFLPACGLPILIAYARARNRNWKLLFRGLVIALVCAFFATWAVYRFSHAPIAQVTHIPDHVAAKVFGPSSRITAVAQAITRHVPLPAPEFIDGIRFLRDQNAAANSRSFLFGVSKTGGWWYYFIVALMLKTPLAVLLLAAIGAVVIIRCYLQRPADWEAIAPLTSFCMVMLVTMPSKLDAGVRYVLPAFLLLAILAAIAVTALWSAKHNRRMWQSAAVVLLGWLTVSSAICHPDYLSYFNELGGKDPSRLIVVGDYDWGQDMARLSTYLQPHSVQHVALAYDGFFVPQDLNFPATQLLECNDTPSGWAVVEVRRTRLHPECYLWMKGQNRIAIVGKTMWVYYVKP